MPAVLGPLRARVNSPPMAQARCGTSSRSTPPPSSTYDVVGSRSVSERLVSPLSMREVTAVR